MKILNFGRALSKEVLQQVEKVFLEVEEIKVTCWLDLQMDIKIQIHNIINSIKEVKLDGSETFILNPPKMSIASLLVYTELFARCGFLPSVMQLYYDNDKNIYILKNLHNLEDWKNKLRKEN